MSGTKLFYIIMFFIGSLSLSSNVFSTGVDEEDTINFVTFYDPPYIFNPSETDKKGLVQIILKKLMDNIGIKYNISMMPPKRAEIFTQTTENTCILPIEKSQEREVLFSWVSPILVTRHGLFQMKDQEPILLEALEDAHPYRLGSYLGSGIGDYLKSFDYQVDFANQNEANIHKLAAGRIDLWSSDILTAQYISKSENIEISESRIDFFTTLKAIGCHPSISKDTIYKMNIELQWLYKTGQIFQIVQQFKADTY